GPTALDVGAGADVVVSYRCAIASRQPGQCLETVHQRADGLLECGKLLDGGLGPLEQCHYRGLDLGALGGVQRLRESRGDARMLAAQRVDVVAHGATPAPARLARARAWSGLMASAFCH